MIKYLRAIVIFAVFINFSFKCFGQETSEITLYNKNGYPEAYISPLDDNCIFLWNGKPVAYLITISQKMNVYGFNGKHLGWFVNGVFRDNFGLIVGFVKGKISNVIENIEPIKGIKQIVPIRKIEEIEPILPAYFKDEFSLLKLSDFLLTGLSSNSQVSDYNGSSGYHSDSYVSPINLNFLSSVLMEKDQVFKKHAEIIQGRINTVFGRVNSILPNDSMSIKDDINSYISYLNSNSIDLSDQNV